MNQAQLVDSLTQSLEEIANEHRAGILALAETDGWKAWLAYAKKQKAAYYHGAVKANTIELRERNRLFLEAFEAFENIPFALTDMLDSDSSATSPEHSASALEPGSKG